MIMKGVFMKSQKTFFTVESHTMGEPLRCVLGGFPLVPGNSVMEKKEYVKKNLDYYRCALMLEPRGHKDMFGSIIVPPCDPKADYGVIFMHGEGYHNMCGHGTIATSTIAIETGLVEVHEPETVLYQEAPAGLVKIKARVESGVAKEISFDNVPSFLYKEGLMLDVPELGNIKVDIAFGGSFFVLVNHKYLGLDICPDNGSELVRLGMKIIETANNAIKVEHPINKEINTIDLCEIYGPAKSKEADMQNITVFDNQIDRSPCGTGTSAKLATLFAKGQLKLNEPFVYESVINTKFEGKCVGETTVGEFKAIIPEITGSAYITGFGQHMIDADDPVKYGFRLK